MACGTGTTERHSHEYWLTTDAYNMDGHEYTVMAETPEAAARQVWDEHEEARELTDNEDCMDRGEKVAWLNVISEGERVDHMYIRRASGAVEWYGTTI